MKQRLTLALTSLLLGSSMAAFALKCFSDPTPPRVTLGGKCIVGSLYVYCTDDQLNNDGHCNAASTGAATCTTAVAGQYSQWKPNHPGYLGSGKCNTDSDCTSFNPQNYHQGNNSGTCQVGDVSSSD